MPITKSAKKALRQSKKRRQRNLRRLDAMKDIIKQIRKLVAENKKQEAAKLLPRVYKVIDKAAKANVIKKNTAARKKSRLTKLIDKGLPPASAASAAEVASATKAGKATADADAKAPPKTTPEQL